MEKAVEGDEVFDIAEDAEFDVIGFFDKAGDTRLDEMWT